MVVALSTAEIRWRMAAGKRWRVDPPPAHLWPLFFATAAVFDAAGPVAQTREIVEPKGRAKTPTVAVRVNHGVWQTQCPFCPSAQHASSSSLLFYCADCMNAANGHKTLPVKWPRDPDAIETQLAKRPRMEYRHWEPGETVRDLERQDREWKEAPAG